MAMQTSIRIITLDKTSHGYSRLAESLKEQGLFYNFYGAVDGRKTTPELYKNETINQDSCFNYRLSILSNSEIGCYLSHYRCILEEFTKGTEKLCILEDDIFLENPFSKHLKLIFTLDNKYELVKLSALKKKKRKPIKTLSSTHTITRPSKGTLGTQGYVINRNGMKKVIDRGMPIKQPIDKFYDHFWETDIQTFSIEPYILWEQATESFVEKPKRINNLNFSKKFMYKTRKTIRSLNCLIYKLKNINSFYPNSTLEDFEWKTTRKLKE